MEAEEPVGVQAQIWSLLEASQEHWLGSFILNLLGYALIIVPAALLIRKWKKDPRVKRGIKRRCIVDPSCFVEIMFIITHLLYILQGKGHSTTV